MTNSNPCNQKGASIGWVRTTASITNRLGGVVKKFQAQSMGPALMMSDEVKTNPADKPGAELSIRIAAGRSKAPLEDLKDVLSMLGLRGDDDGQASEA